ncbi:MAG: type II toxin-antitoxin system prevent-host-death family antitoxin [Patescibacteria group bacterium]
MTIVMLNTVSKSQFKAKALEYLREVEKKKKKLVITHNGEPVADVIPHKEVTDPLESLQGTLIFYKYPNRPAAPLSDWNALKK